MSRKIILLSDGTGNSAAKVWRTNVWRTFEALDLSGNDQVAFYDDGVGTSSFKPMAILGGAFGFGLQAQRHRRSTSSPAATIATTTTNCSASASAAAPSPSASSMGLIVSQGLVKADNEAELHRQASAAYRAYRRDRYHNLSSASRRPYQRDPQHVRPDNYRQGRQSQECQDRFVGVWDTVAAYGMPIDEMTRGISQYLWPLELPGPRTVPRASRAPARRWRSTRSAPPSTRSCGTRPATPPAGERRWRTHSKRFIKDERISQVWFAGVHTNVGGGYPDDALAYIPFVWMITEAQRCGLKFKSDYAGQPPSPDT